MRDSDKDFIRLVDTLKENYEVINKRHDQIMKRVNGKTKGGITAHNDCIEHGRNHSKSGEIDLA